MNITLHLEYILKNFKVKCFREINKMVCLKQEALLVHNALLLQGLESPLTYDKNGDNLSDQVRELRITKHMFAIMDLLNLDLKNDSLIDTPKRIAKMYINEFFYGLNYANFPTITIFENKMKVDEMVVIRDISVISMCEHHFIIFYGVATVAYIPRACIIGLSKVNRIVDFFSKRPQVQERLTQQILLALQVLLGTESVAIFMDAVHFCVKARGVRNDSNTVTVALGGIFKSSPNVRQEFFRTTDSSSHSS